MLKVTFYNKWGKIEEKIVKQFRVRVNIFIHLCIKAKLERFSQRTLRKQKG